jgi:chitin synthase
MKLVVARPNSVRDDGANCFEQLNLAPKSVGMSKRHVAQTYQLIAAILHLTSSSPSTAVMTLTELSFATWIFSVLVAELLGVQPSALENTLAYKTKLAKKKLCTVFLDPDGASDNRDDLAKTLYSLLFAWLNECINQRLCRDDFETFNGLFDLPGPQNMTSRPNERFQNFMQKWILESHVDEYQMEGISRFVPLVPYFDNVECVRLLQNKPGGLVHTMVTRRANHTRRWSTRMRSRNEIASAMQRQKPALVFAQ